jgi:hypothetical protein
MTFSYPKSPLPYLKQDIYVNVFFSETNLEIKTKFHALFVGGSIWTRELKNPVVLFNQKGRGRPRPEKSRT